MKEKKTKGSPAFKLHRMSEEGLMAPCWSWDCQGQSWQYLTWCIGGCCGPHIRGRQPFLYRVGYKYFRLHGPAGHSYSVLQLSRKSSQRQAINEWMSYRWFFLEHSFVYLWTLELEFYIIFNVTEYYSFVVVVFPTFQKIQQAFLSLQAVWRQAVSHSSLTST